MASFVWSEHFVTGLTAVDEQHHRLVDLINGYGDRLAGADLAAADQQDLLAELYAYADYHFREEDALAVARGVDPRHLRMHQADHARFLTDVRAIGRQVHAGSPEAARSLLGFLVHWLGFHILVQDQNMARQIASIDAGATPAQAYEAQQRDPAGATEPLVVALSGLFHQVSEQNLALHELNRTLEARVQERTRALSEANVQLEELAMTDVLTGLPNRRHGLTRLRILWSEASAHAEPLACLMVDADGFKQVNDTYGHDAGDGVLRALARCLRETVRTDDVVCRLGGDEFLVICPGTDQAGASVVGELVRAAVAGMRVPAGDGVWHGSVSVGVGSRTAAMGGYEDLLKAADDAVYAAKRGGRNCVRAA